jgi:hypothetical protein
MAVEAKKMCRPNGVEDKTRVKQCRGMCAGVYIKCSVEGVPVLFTANTGASRTVISTMVFNKKAERKQLELQTSSCLVDASGLPIQECRNGHFVAQLGTHKTSIEAVIANIDNGVLLGFISLKGYTFCSVEEKIISDVAEISCFDEGKRFKVTNSRRLLGNADIVDARADSNEVLKTVSFGRN